MFRYAQLLKSNKFDLFIALQYIVHGCIFIKISDQFTCVHENKENSQKINLTKIFFIYPTNCNKFYCNLTFYKLNTYLILTSACLVLWSKTHRPTRIFKRNILVTRGDPLSAHVRACAVVVVDRRMSRVLHCIFGPQKTNYAGR